MAATLWNGAFGGTNLSVNNTVNTVSFQPDLVWSKTRNNAYNHYLQDSVRGITNGLSSNLTAAEATTSGSPTSFTSTGFNISSTDTWTSLGNTEVSWQWKAGGTAVSNTAGTITSSVSANTTAGFSVVTYTGNGTGGATIGHGVQAGGVATAPSFIIVKNRSTTATDWECYQITLGNTYRIRLNRAFVADTGGALWANTTPTSTVFSVASDLDVNSSSETYVAYCWAPVAGYSAFGSYTGNGSADGPFIYTGFRPRWILIKSSTVATSWYLLDSARETYNEEKIFLYPDLPAADSPQSAGVDFLSNGFKVRAGAGLGINNASGGYIYACFAENPLRYSNAR